MTRDDERLDIGDAPAEHPASIPSELPVLPLRDTVLFPNSFLPLAVARESSVRLRWYTSHCENYSYRRQL